MVTSIRDTGFQAKSVGDLDQGYHRRKKKVNFWPLERRNIAGMQRFQRIANCPWKGLRHVPGGPTFLKADGLS
jgi:hypothetical protein